MQPIVSQLRNFALNLAPVIALGWLATRRGAVLPTRLVANVRWSSWRIAVVCTTAFLVPYGLLGLSHSFSGSNLALWLLSIGVWHAIFTGMVIWLLPSCQLQSACVPAESRVE